MLNPMIIYNDIGDDISSSPITEVEWIETTTGLHIPAESIQVKPGIYVNSEFTLVTGKNNLNFVRSILLRLPISEKFIPDQNSSNIKVYFNADFKYKNYVKRAFPDIYSIDLFHNKTGKGKKFHLGSHISAQNRDLVKRTFAPFFLVRYELLFRKKIEDMGRLGIEEL
ncbi:hypothetical protein [Proteus mirabilis]|uniref:hypothetical protein n=1 Tax=Proteus mirabilis TaxID=584 RepID=UPI0034D788B5